MSSETPKIKLDPSKLVGFDQAPAVTAAKIGNKPINRPASAKG